MKNCAKNLKPDLDNVDVHAKLGSMMSIHSQAIEWKPYSSTKKDHKGNNSSINFRENEITLP